MEPDLSKLNNEELKRILHAENFKFAIGIERALPLNELNHIRQNIRRISAEIDKRNLMVSFKPSKN